MQNPSLPANLPANSLWSEADKTWAFGQSNSAGQRQGFWQIWDAKGQLLAEYHYDEQGLRQGRFRSFESDTVIAEGEYRKDKLEGLVEYRRAKKIRGLFQNLQHTDIVRVQAYYLDGELQGSRYFNSKGELCNYYGHRCYRLPQGAWWLNKKQLWAYNTEQPDNGKGFGKGYWQFWELYEYPKSEGQLDEQGRWHGSVKFFGPNGNLSAEGEYVEDKPEGWHKYYPQHHSYYNHAEYRGKSDSIKSQETLYRQGQAIEHRFFDEKGSRLSRQGYAYLEAEVASLFDSSPSEFLLNGYFEAFLRRMLGANYGPTDVLAEARYIEQVEAYWGSRLPDELSLALRLFRRAQHPEGLKLNFQGPEADNFMALEAQGKSAVEACLLKMQREYPYDEVWDWCTGAISLDKPRIYERYAGWRPSEFSFFYQLASGPGQGRIWALSHQSYSHFSYNQVFPQAFAADLGSFLYLQALLWAYFKHDLLSDEQLHRALERLEGKINLPEDYLSNKGISLPGLFFSRNILNKLQIKESPLLTNFAYNILWAELLRGELPAQQVASYKAECPVAATPQAEQAALQGKDLGAAFAVLGRALLEGAGPERWQQYQAWLEPSNSALLRSAAEAFPRLDFAAYFGQIRDLKGRKQAWRELLLQKA